MTAEFRNSASRPDPWRPRPGRRKARPNQAIERIAAVAPIRFPKPPALRRGALEGRRRRSRSTNRRRTISRNVLRLKPGDAVLAVQRQATANGGRRWPHGKRIKLARAGADPAADRAADLHYLFAPLKHERLDYMVQKAVEMGVSRLQPVLTQHTQVERVNLERMRANAIEAAEQCGVLSIPEIAEPMTFARALAARKPDRLLVFCDEDAGREGPGGRARRRARGAERDAAADDVGRRRRRAAAGAADRARRRLCRGGARRAAEASRTSCGCRSVRAFCAPTPRRWRRWRWSRRCSGDWR